MPFAARRLVFLSTLALLSACQPPASLLGKLDNGQERHGMEMAENMKNSGNIEGAASVYRELMVKDSGSVAAHIALASMYRKAGRADEALNVLREAQKRKPADEEVLSQLGYALISAKQPEEAVHVFDLVTAINHDNAAAYNGKAVAFDNAGNHVAAQELYEKALKLSPGSPTIQNNMALSLILNDQVDSAIGILEPLSQEKNASPTIRHNLALAYGVRGDHERAREINMRDMTPQQAKENQFFYEHYAHMIKQQRVAALAPEMQPSLPDALAEEAAPIAKPAPAAPPAAVAKTAPAAPKPLAKAPPVAKPQAAEKTAPVPVEASPSAGKAVELKALPEETPAEESESPAKAAEGKFWGYDASYGYPSGKR